MISKKRFHEEAESEDERLQESTTVMSFFGTKAMSISSSVPKSFYRPGKPLTPWHGAGAMRVLFFAAGQDIEHNFVYIFFGRKNNGMHMHERFFVIVQSRIHVTRGVDSLFMLEALNSARR